MAEAPYTLDDSRFFEIVKHTEDGLNIGVQEDSLIGAIVPNTNYTPIKILEIDRDVEVPNLGFNLSPVGFDKTASVVGLDMQSGDIQYFYRDGKTATWGRADLLLSLKVFKNTNNDFNNKEQPKVVVGNSYITRAGKRVFCFMQVNGYKYKVIEDTSFNRQLAQDAPAVAGYEVWFNGTAVTTYTPVLTFEEVSQSIHVVLDVKSIYTFEPFMESITGVGAIPKKVFNASKFLNSTFSITYAYAQPGSTVTLTKQVKGSDLVDEDFKARPYVLTPNPMGENPFTFLKFSAEVDSEKISINRLMTIERQTETVLFLKSEDIIDDWASPLTRVFFAKSQIKSDSPESSAIPLVQVDTLKISNWQFEVDKFQTAAEPDKFAYLEVHMRKISPDDFDLPKYRLSENT